MLFVCGTDFGTQSGQFCSVQTYRELYETTSRLLPPPDLVVYLRASVATLMNRITHRGRDYERTIAADYLAGLNNLYEYLAGTNPTNAASFLKVNGAVGAGAAVVSHTNMSLPPARPAGRILGGDTASAVSELVRLLRDEAKVI